MYNELNDTQNIGRRTCSLSCPTSLYSLAAANWSSQQLLPSLSMSQLSGPRFPSSSWIRRSFDSSFCNKSRTSDFNVMTSWPFAVSSFWKLSTQKCDYINTIWTIVDREGWMFKNNYNTSSINVTGIDSFFNWIYQLSILGYNYWYFSEFPCIEYSKSNIYSKVLIFCIHRNIFAF